jgi:hypothetical protein
MSAHELTIRICIPAREESAVRDALAQALPELQWEEGDSSYDKIRVWGAARDVAIRLYRYESPGPFQLTVTAASPSESLALRDRVLEALHATLWKPLEPQPVALIKPEGRFPSAYHFASDLELSEIKRVLDDAEFWSWETRQSPRLGVYLEGRTPVRTRSVRIRGAKPAYTIEVGEWPGSEHIHEAVQTTLLPALSARHISA